MSKRHTPTDETSDLVDRVNKAFLDTNYPVRVLKATTKTVSFRLEGIASGRTAAEYARIHLADHGIYARERFNSDLGGWHTIAKEWA